MTSPSDHRRIVHAERNGRKVKQNVWTPTYVQSMPQPFAQVRVGGNTTTAHDAANVRRGHRADIGQAPAAEPGIKRECASDLILERSKSSFLEGLCNRRLFTRRQMRRAANRLNETR